MLGAVAAVCRLFVFDIQEAHVWSVAGWYGGSLLQQPSREGGFVQLQQTIFSKKFLPNVLRNSQNTSAASLDQRESSAAATDDDDHQGHSDADETDFIEHSLAKSLSSKEPGDSPHNYNASAAEGMEAMASTSTANNFQMDRQQFHTLYSAQDPEVHGHLFRDSSPALMINASLPEARMHEQGHSASAEGKAQSVAGRWRISSRQRVRSATDQSGIRIRAPVLVSSRRLHQGSGRRPWPAFRHWTCPRWIVR